MVCSEAKLERTVAGAADNESLFSSSPCLLIVLDAEGKILQWSAACHVLIGRSAEEVRGQNIWDVLAPPERRAHWIQTFPEILRNQEGAGDGQWLTAGGRRRFVRWSAAVDRSAAPGSERVLISAVDLTDVVGVKHELARLADQEHRIFEELPALVSVRDVEGRFVFANGRFRRTFGIARDAISGRVPADLFSRPVVVRFEKLQQAARRGFSQTFEETFEIHGRTVELVTTVLPLYDAEERFAGTCVLSDDRTQARAMARLLELQNRDIAKLSARLSAAEEDERRRIARELHDGINQEVAALAVELGMLGAEESATPEEIRKQVAELGERARIVSDHVRRVSHQLHPAALETLGLSDALRSFAFNLRKQPGVRLESHVEDAPAGLPLQKATCIYRVAQEAVHNAVQHAQAGSIGLSLTVSESTLRLEVDDDGQGFDLVQARDGIGLVGMQERARIAGGRLEIRSTAGSGAHVVMELPLRGDHS